MPILVIFGIIGIAVMAVLVVRRGSRPVARRGWDQQPSNDWADNTSLAAGMLLNSLDTTSTPSAPDVSAASYDSQPTFDSQTISTDTSDLQVEAPETSSNDTSSNFDSGASGDWGGSDSSN